MKPYRRAWRGPTPARCVALLAGAISLLASCALAKQYRYEMKREAALSTVYFSDLVIHAEVVSLHSEIIKDRDWFSEGESASEDPYPIQVIEVDVLEVLKGSFKTDRLEVIVPGGYAQIDDRHAISMDIDMMADGYSYDYSIGEEYILCLDYYPNVRGGAYRVSTDRGRFKRVDGVWENQATHRRTSDALERVKGVGKDSEVDGVFHEADVVALGMITNVSVVKRMRRTSQNIATVSMSVTQGLKGVSGGSTVQFKMVFGGGVDLSWYTPTPRVKVGERWLIFLKVGEEGLYPFAGANGMLKIDGERVYRGKNIPYPIGKSELLDALEKETMQR